MSAASCSTTSMESLALELFGTGSSRRARKAAETRRARAVRRRIDPTTCDRDYSQEELEFMAAMDAYKRSAGRPFPTWSEVLEVLQSLGYRKGEPLEAAPRPSDPREAAVASQFPRRMADHLGPDRPRAEAGSPG